MGVAVQVQGRGEDDARGVGPEAGARARVLVIDDDPDCLASICQILEDEGFETDGAEDGARGVAMARARLPSLVLCDVRMPVQDGFDTLRQLRGDAAMAHLPFVFLSAGVDLKEVRRGMNLGADDYLVKPFTSEDLVAAVRARLRRSQRDAGPTLGAPPVAGAGRGATALLPPLVAGRYLLQRRVGRGGMGSVYLAEDVSRGERVALKLVADVRRCADRFERECAILASLRHPRVVRYHEHGVTADGDPFLVMDWLDGEDLAERMTRGTLSVRDAARLLRHAAEALAAVHDAGVVHRDVKPGNLFLVQGDVERLSLIDFGVARPPEALAFTLPGEVLGTPGFLAPEQVLHADAATASSDVYGLGCTVYAALVGHAPRGGELGEVTGDGARREGAGPVTPLRPDVPPALAAILSAMLDQDPTARPRDGRAVLQRLDALGA
jgi:CheY-like chemotaxis protein